MTAKRIVPSRSTMAQCCSLCCRWEKVSSTASCRKPQASNTARSARSRLPLRRGKFGFDFAGAQGQTGGRKNGGWLATRNVGQLRTFGAALAFTNCCQDLAGKGIGSQAWIRTTIHGSTSIRLLTM
jgi:hypothetical protein